MQAVMRTDLTCIRTLIDAGANVNAQTSQVRGVVISLLKVGGSLSSFI